MWEIARRCFGQISLHRRYSHLSIWWLQSFQTILGTENIFCASQLWKCIDFAALGSNCKGQSSSHWLREKRGCWDWEYLATALFILTVGIILRNFIAWCANTREAKTRLNVNLFMFDDKIFCLNEVLKYLLWTVIEENKLAMISIRSCEDENADFCSNKDKLFWNNPHCQLRIFKKLKIVLMTFLCFDN